MNSGNFFMPNVGTQIPPFFQNASLIGNGSFIPKRVGLLGRTLGGIKSFNWSGLLNGANKTLNVVNQTIPLVRQAGPMFNNMKSMMKLAKAFGTETFSQRKNNKNTRSNFNNKVDINNSKNHSYNDSSKVLDNSNNPIFFI